MIPSLMIRIFNQNTPITGILYNSPGVNRIWGSAYGKKKNVGLQRNLDELLTKKITMCSIHNYQMTPWPCRNVNETWVLVSNQLVMVTHFHESSMVLKWYMEHFRSILSAFL